MTSGSADKNLYLNVYILWNFNKGKWVTMNLSTYHSNAVFHSCLPYTLILFQIRVFHWIPEMRIGPADRVVGRRHLRRLDAIIAQISRYHKTNTTPDNLSHSRQHNRVVMDPRFLVLAVLFPLAIEAATTPNLSQILLERCRRFQQDIRNLK